MQILAFSDLHGNAATLKLLKESIEDESYDYTLIAGDLTNADLISPTKTVQQVKEIFSILESFKFPYYYVWGTPFREGTLASALQLVEKQQDYEVSEHEGKIFLKKKMSNHIEEIIEISKRGWHLCKEVERFLSSLKFGKHLKNEEPVKIGKYWLTANPKKVPKNAIFLKHHYRKIIPRALIQLDGHLHFGQHVLNYLNLGFLYRDESHGASPMIGCYWKLTLKDSTVSVEFVNLGRKLKGFKCPDHPKEGTFYIPFYWKSCPICFNSKEAIIKGER